MDRNTLTGLVLIGLILTVFSIVNQPSEEDLKKEQEKELALQKKEQEKSKKAALASAEKTTNKGSSSSVPALAIAANGESVRLESDKIIVDFNTKGGIIEAVYLKSYRSYEHFAKKMDKPLCLFKSGDAKNQLIIPNGNQKLRTSNYLFEIVEKTENRIVFSWQHPEGKVQQTYQLKNGAYDLDYKIKLEGFENVVRKNVQFNWQASFRKTERLFSEQRRVTTVCYEQEKDGFSYLSETMSDYEEPTDNLNWIAYKQSYFTSIIKPSKPFTKEGGELKVEAYKEGHPRNWSHLKDFHSTVGLSLQNNEMSFNWYFGPNDYEILKTYKSNYDDILNLGWGLFRWINLYAVQPIFNFLVGSGLPIGIAILLLTFILKTVLMPIQWKMFVSSVKMRILKPEVDALNEKYPKQEDAMKKQMEMMTLYRESGASPLAGCVPMLIQMPILLAVFRFFPAAFELRQQSFLWAEDLSSFDSIVDLPVYIWFYGDHVSLFTLLMAGTTLLYTHMNSGNMQQPQQPGMPNMKVIMYIFPVMMIFFFNNYSSGLSYYYFISTLISILMMVIIKQFFVNEDKLRLKMAEKKTQNAGKEKKKSRFQEKLEQMQRQQQEMMKNRKK
jgi:YidC/Oxa1 family membrane protein insertase